MGLLVGSLDINKAFVGSTPVSKMFVGETQVYPAGPPLPDGYVFYSEFVNSGSLSTDIGKQGTLYYSSSYFCINKQDFPDPSLIPSGKNVYVRNLTSYSYNRQYTNRTTLTDRGTYYQFAFGSFSGSWRNNGTDMLRLEIRA